MEELIKYKDFLIARNLSTNYFNVIRILLSFLQTKSIEFNAITQDIITEFFNTNNYSSNTKNQFIKGGRNYGDYLQIPKEQNQFYQIKLMKTERKIPDYLTEKDLGEAKKYLITYESKRISIPKINALLDFLFYSGIRKAELLNLKRTDFNFEENSVKVFGKGDKERITYYPEKIKKEIQDYFASEPEQINAFNITLGKINYMAIQIGKYLGKRIYTHLFRHSGAREMQRKGIPLAILSKILGHGSIATTMIYCDENEEGRRNIYKERMK